MGLLVFDGDCAFCTSTVAFARRWVNSDTEAVPWQLADLASLGLSQQSCAEAVQYRDRRGRWSSAGRAVTALLQDARAPWSWVGHLAALPGLVWAVDHIYVFVANNRHRLPGGTPACRLPESPPSP